MHSTTVLQPLPQQISYLAPEKKSLEEVSRVPLTAPKVEQATKMGMNQEYLPYIRLANVTATASDLKVWSSVFFVP